MSKNQKKRECIASVPFPKTVEVRIEDSLLFVRGPKGILTLPCRRGISLSQGDSCLSLCLVNGEGGKQKFLGLYRALIRNMIYGVQEGFSKNLQLVGVGFRSSVEGGSLWMNVGYSHPVILPIPDGLEVKIEKGTEITVSGIDKQLVGLYAAQIRSKRPPDPYKKKGVRYLGEYIRQKAGKKQK